MRGVFWRIFGWYMASSALIVAAGFVYVYVTDPDLGSMPTASISSRAIMNQALDVSRTWQRDGKPGLQKMFPGIQRPRLLFDANGRQLWGNNPLPPNFGELISRALVTAKEIEWGDFPPDTYTAIPIRVNGVKFIFARTLPPELNYQHSTKSVWSRVLVGLITSTVIWLLLARFVASPITQLRAVTKEFAAGNLAARIGDKKPFNRDDEFSDLARDIDQMAAQLQNFLDQQHRLLGDISHELRSPLSRLQLALEIARRKADPAAQDALDRIETEAERLNVLIGQILRSAKTEVDPGARKLFDLSNLIREVAADADFEASAQNRHVLIRNNEPSLVHGDRDLVRSAIENVVRNAIRYTPSWTDVTIDLHQVDGSHAIVTVRDCGTGVPDDALPLLFQPFYRVNDARDRDSGGAGLGLAITQHAIAAHNGTVRANNCKDGGFEVQIDLPMKVPEVAKSLGITFRDKSGSQKN